MFSVQSSSKRKCGRVHITISSFKETYLEINWINDCFHPLDIEPTFIVLYDKDPRGRVSVFNTERNFLL